MPPDAPSERGEQTGDSHGDRKRGSASAGAAAATARSFDFPDVLEGITDGFLGLDKEWTIVYLNAAAERMAGQTRDKLVGRCLWDQFPEVRGTQVEAVYRGVMEHRQPRRFEFAWREGWYELRVYPAGSGGINVYVLDVTHHRR
ncbi:MAG TPA: PAS domain-containing protein, partial [Bryobacteraceae bacterium]